MKKVIISVALIFALSAVKAQTPVAFIEQVPALPSVEILAASKSQPAAAPARGLRGALATVQNAATGGSELDQFKTQISQQRQIADAQQMSATMAVGAEAGIPGMGVMPGMPAAGGMGGLTAAEMQALQGMTPEQQQDFVLKKQADAMGLTLEEFKSMQTMTPAQQEAFLKDPARMQRMAEAIAKQADAMAGTSMEAAVTKIVEDAENDPFYDMRTAMENAIEQERTAVVAQLKQLQQKHNGDLTAEFYKEAYTIWRGQIEKEQTRIKALLAEVQKLGDMNAWTLVGDYIEATENVLELPELN